MDARIARIIEFVQSNPDVGMFPTQEDLPFLSRMGASRDCEVVWSAIERRLDVASKLHEKTLISVFGSDPEQARQMCETSFEEEVWRLMGAVSDALRTPSFAEAAISSERRKVAIRAAKAAQTLKSVLAALSEDDMDTNINRSLRSFAGSRAESALKSFRDLSNESGWKELAEVAADPHGAGIAELVAETVVVEPGEFIDALLAGINAWAVEEPMIPRPSDQNAERLRMIRVLTAHFVHRYGSPLRQQVLAIVGTFFRADDLTESAIAKLAPVRTI